MAAHTVHLHRELSAAPPANRLARAALPRPCRLEINNSGSWKVIGRFDAADDAHTSLVLDAAEELVKTLNNGAPVKQCASLRISIDDMLNDVLLRWTADRGYWYDPRTGDRA